MKKFLPALGVVGGVAAVLGTLAAFSFAGAHAGSPSTPQPFPSLCQGAAQQTFPPTSDLSPGTFTLQTTEPATGYLGACLFCYMTYQPALPLGCYVPANANWGVPGQISITPAAQVARSYSALPAQYDSYMGMMTCSPHDPSQPNGCPPYAVPISNSCCDYGQNLVSLDGKTATSPVHFTVP